MKHQYLIEVDEDYSRYLTLYKISQGVAKLLPVVGNPDEIVLVKDLGNVVQPNPDIKAPESIIVRMP